MNRILSMFEKLKRKEEVALMTYLPFRNSTNLNTLDLAKIFIDSGIDILEIGLPCWNPWLDGKTMQLNHKLAISGDVTIEKAFKITKKIRDLYPNFPLVPMANYDVIYSIGIKQFITRLRDIKADGVEIPDYPFVYLNDPHNLYKALKENNIYFITFIDGLTNKSTDKDIVKFIDSILLASQGFIFLLASPGVTGAREEINVENINNAVSFLRKRMEALDINLPILAGFGISKPSHIKELVTRTSIDAIVVGSAISKLVQDDSPPSVISKFIQELKKFTKK